MIDRSKLFHEWAIKTSCEQSAVQPVKRGDFANDLCAVFPVAWIVERDTEYEFLRVFLTEEEAYKNAALGVATVRVSPLYKHSQIGNLERLLDRLKRLLALADEALGEHGLPSDAQVYLKARAEQHNSPVTGLLRPLDAVTKPKEERIRPRMLGDTDPGDGNW